MSVSMLSAVILIPNKERLCIKLIRSLLAPFGPLGLSLQLLGIGIAQAQVPIPIRPAELENP